MQIYVNNRDCKMDENLITVFTPTFNRAYVLRQLYASLALQSNMRFEWLIVDDGSTDDTEMLVNDFKKNATFSIRYFKYENGGKHRAINKGVNLAKGFYFFIVDSDDQLTKDAIKKIYEWEKSIEKKEGFAGISGNKGDIFGNLLGSTFKGKYIDATNIERKENNILGDKSEVYYTDVLKKFPFPEIEGETFMTEAIVWDRIAEAGFKIRWFNEIIYVVEQHSDGLIAQGNLRYANNPRGYALYVMQNDRIYRLNWKEKLYSGYYYYDVVKSKVSLNQASKLINRNAFIFALFYVFQSCKIFIKRRFVA